MPRSASLLLLFALALPAAAGEATPPAPVSIVGWDVVRYNDTIADAAFRATANANRAANQMPAFSTPEDFRAFQAQTLAAYRDALASIEALPAWKGDASLRDAALASMRWCVAFSDGGLSEMYELISKEHVQSADLDRLEELTRKADAEADALDASMRETQVAFAKKNRFLLVDQNERLPEVEERPDFSAPGIPPEGSALSGSVHVGFAIRYHNGLAADEVALVDAMNQFMDATHAQGPEVEQARKAALDAAKAALDSALSRGDWRGDAALQQSTVALGREVVDVLSGPAAEIASLLEKAPMKKKSVERYNALAEDMGARLDAALASWSSAERDFNQRWGLDAYMGWVQARSR